MRLAVHVHTVSTLYVVYFLLKDESLALYLKLPFYGYIVLALFDAIRFAMMSKRRYLVLHESEHASRRMLCD